MTLEALVSKVGARLEDLPAVWDGRAAIQEMKTRGDPNWRQMEWIGFYFQFLCAERLSPIMEIPGPAYGRPRFDSLLGVPWDFKAHAMNARTKSVIVNDAFAVAGAIRDYGAVMVALAVGNAAYNDADRSFQRWHGVLKGGVSAYEKERIRRGAWSRVRKTSFHL